MWKAYRISLPVSQQLSEDRGERRHTLRNILRVGMGLEERLKFETGHTIRAVVQHTDGLRLQVDFGHEQRALIYEWQVVKRQGPD